LSWEDAAVLARLVVDRRFNGPPDSGHGGYVCGLLSKAVDGSAEITLRRPPPLATQLTVEATADGGVTLTDGPFLVGEGRPVPPWRPDHPEPPDVATAAAAGRAAPARDPNRHPQPWCFGCGTGRAEDDGLRIVVGPVPGADLVADVWTPDASLADAEGAVAEEFVWAALDCPSGFAGGLLGDLPPILLGRMSAMLLAPVPIGEDVVCTGWVIDRTGRKLISGSGLFSAGGVLLAAAAAVWIVVERP
jgi:hypothetical protein